MFFLLYIIAKKITVRYFLLPYGDGICQIVQYRYYILYVLLNGGLVFIEKNSFQQARYYCCSVSDLIDEAKLAYIGGRRCVGIVAAVVDKCIVVEIDLAVVFGK